MRCRRRWPGETFRSSRETVGNGGWSGRGSRTVTVRSVMVPLWSGRPSSCRSAYRETGERNGVGGAEHRADQGSGAGLHQRHQLQHGAAAPAAGAEPAHVAGGVSQPDRAAAVEGHRPEASEPDPGRRRSCQWPGQDLEQAADRHCTEPSAQVTQGLRGRPGNIEPRAGQRRGEVVPDQPVADLREQAHRQQEVDPDPRRKILQAALHAARPLKDRIDELKRHDLRQLAQTTRPERPRGHNELMREPCQTGWCGTMTYGQRGTSKISSLGGPFQRGPVARVTIRR